MSTVDNDLLAALVDAIAANTGQAAPDLDEEVRDAKQGDAAAVDEIQTLIDRVKTRLGIAPAVDKEAGARLRETLKVDEGQRTITKEQVAVLDRLLRHTPERVPTPGHAYFRPADDPVGVHGLLSRLAR